MGTAAYMAPEQILGDREVTEAVDAYAFAVLAYELLTGSSPFKATGPRALLDAHLHGVPRPAREIVTGFPEPAARVLLAGLEKDPSRRAGVREIADVVASVPIGSWPAIPERESAGPSQGGRPTTVVIEQPDQIPAAPPPAPKPVDRVPVAGSAESVTPGLASELPPSIEPPVFQPAGGHRSRARRRMVAVLLGAGLGVAAVLLAFALGVLR